MGPGKAAADFYLEHAIKNHALGEFLSGTDATMTTKDSYGGNVFAMNQVCAALYRRAETQPEIAAMVQAECLRILNGNGDAESALNLCDVICGLQSGLQYGKKDDPDLLRLDYPPLIEAAENCLKRGREQRPQDEERWRLMALRIKSMKETQKAAKKDALR